MTEARHCVNASHESEVKRKKNALEKAKANYLCSQLRLRLQYAKLKVDHGWQKQTLNEVENLYFRHSQANRQLFTTNVSEHSTSQHSDSDTGTQANTFAPMPLHEVNGTSSDTVSTDVSDKATHSKSQTASPSRVATFTEQSTEITTPSKPPLSTPGAKGKERDHSLSTMPLCGAHPTPTQPSLSASPRANPFTNYLPPTAANDFPPATSSDALPSSAKYLSSIYISSSPFPINVPISTQDSTSSTSPFGKSDQALTYDSFWSSHSTWSSHVSMPDSGSPTRPTTTGMQRS
ncbi:hypothetical protein BC835DRAFT_797353 [Cytidiella melzeri]|nr:hypothetical protein BC835DRAFT_797353 [Cytidiella melzeri]